MQSSGFEESEEAKRARKLENATIELFTTEKTYHKNLQTLVHSFLHRFRCRLSLGHTPVLLTDSEITCIFANIETIYDLNCTLYQKLKELHRKSFDELFEGIGPLFKRMMPFFTMYTVYCNAYDKGVALLEDLLKSRKELRNYLEIEQLCENGMRLQSFLILPIQRIPRYVMLLEEMVKQASDGRVGVEDIEAALVKVRGLAVGVNTKMGHWLAKEKVFKIAGRFAGAVDLLAPNRYWIHDGPLKKVHKHRERHLKTAQKYWFFLFNDILLVAIKTDLVKVGELLRHKRTLKLQSLKISDLEDTENFANGFLISSSDQKEKDMTVYATSQAEKDEWIKVLTETIAKAKGVTIAKKV